MKGQYGSRMHTHNSTYLGCHKLGCTAKRARRGTKPHVFLTKTVVGNLDVTVKSEENVVELQVSVYDTVFVEIFESQADLSSVEPGELSAKFTISSDELPYWARFVPNCPRWM